MQTVVSNPIFIISHIPRSEVGLLEVIVIDGNTKFRFVAFKGLDASNPREITVIPKTLTCLSSCSGLLLCRDQVSKSRCVINPVTKEMILLPPCKDRYYSWVQDLVFVPSTMTYKLAELLFDTQGQSAVFHVQTLGVPSSDSWSTIAPTPFHSAFSEKISVNGILYIYYHNDFNGSNHPVRTASLLLAFG
ncbi:hypothetical protein IFM89_026614 [Coptis chinensis]|uniref:F-box associated beta-propeller type 3 domain-containing protein n=1 Tax=Coptis chinensis TaxID=261450 RepID=A0A835HD88_9MAGN|nr:hypothetical protein IFM89_026614 [Coptis chinensis]